MSSTFGTRLRNSLHPLCRDLTHRPCRYVIGSIPTVSGRIHTQGQASRGDIVNDFSLPRRIPESTITASNVSHHARFSLAKKTVIVTGGGRGLGITLAEGVLEAGGNVACLDILEAPSRDEWTTLQKLATETGLKATYHQCDVTEEAELEHLIGEVASKASSHGAPFYGAIACAGIQQKLLAVDYPASDFERILKVNVTGAFLTAKHSAKVLIKEGTPGSIVLIASMSGQIANRGLYCTAYNSSKAAVQQMCRSLAHEWGQHGIRVNTLSPGYIRTAMTDELLEAEPELKSKWMAGALLGRLGAPSDFKSPAIFLLAQGSSFMTGADLRVDGGQCATS